MGRSAPEQSSLPAEVEANRPHLLVVQSHPVQYHAPIYRELSTLGLSVTTVYGSDFSIRGYRDREFGTSFSWDTDLLSGYRSEILTREGSLDEMPSRTLQRSLDRSFRNSGASAVLIHGYSSRIDRIAIRTALRHNVPMILRGETTDLSLSRNRLKSWLRDRALRRLYRRLSAAAYIGTHSRNHYVRLGIPPHRLFFSPYAIDPSPMRTTEADRETMRAGVRVEWNIPEQKTLILFSGKLIPKKGVDLIPIAVGKLPDSVKSSTVFGFLGDGELKSALMSRFAQENQVQTVWFGFQNQSQISRFYHAAEFLLLPSRFGETWGLVVNEALHHGLPCVVSDRVGSAVDLITPGITGELFPADDADGLAAGIMRATKRIGQPGIRDACRKHVAPYSIANAAAGIWNAFQSVMSGGASAS